MATIDGITRMGIKYLTPIEVGIPSRNFEEESTKTILGYYVGSGKDCGMDVLFILDSLDVPDSIRECIESKEKGVSGGYDNTIQSMRCIHVANIRYIRVLERKEELKWTMGEYSRIYDKYF